MGISNIELWNAVRAHNPTFAAHTSEGTAELFTERGFAQITQGGMQILNEFWQLAMPYYLQLVNISHAKDPLEDSGFGEHYDVPWGGYIQRMSVNSVLPVSPAYRNLANGAGPDPFVVRKPEALNRFWLYNYDYQSLITMPDEWANKQIFISENGMSEFLAGVFAGLQNGYTLQSYVNKLEVLNGMLHDTKHPLKTSQIVTVEMSDTPTADQLIDFQRNVMNTVEIMTTSAQTGGYNAMGFASTQEKGRLKLLVRPGYTANLALDVVRGSYNADTLALGVDIVVVPHFGGLVPYKEAAYTTKLFPVYDTLGSVIGFAESDGETTPTVDTANVFWMDPNADTYAILADKGAIFTCRQNPYVVEPIRNPRGLYTNYWASSPNALIAYDPIYNVVQFKTSAAAAAALSGDVKTSAVMPKASRRKAS